MIQASGPWRAVDPRITEALFPVRRRVHTYSFKAALYKPQEILRSEELAPALRDLNGCVNLPELLALVRMNRRLLETHSPLVAFGSQAGDGPEILVPGVFSDAGELELKLYPLGETRWYEFHTFPVYTT